MDVDSVNLMAAWLDGDDDAATEIFERYVRRLVALAASRLSASLNGRFDPDDVVQSAFRSFFRKAQDGEVVLTRSGDLWRVLAAYTINKTRSRVAHHYAAKNTPLAEEGGSHVLLDAFQQEPTPDEAVALADLIEGFLDQLPPRDGVILGQLLQGETVASIALEVGVSEATVRRVRRNARDHLRNQLLSD